MAYGAPGGPDPTAGGGGGADAAGPDGRAELARAAVYGAIDEVGRAEIAGELRDAAAAPAGAGAGGGRLAASPAAAPGGPIDRAVGIAAGRAGLPDPRAGAFRTGVDDADMAASVLTSLLHYLLSAASVPSQRRVAVGGAEIDVVVPDAAGLPDAVAVCIAGEAGGSAAGSRAAAASAALRLPCERIWTAAWSRRSGHSAAAASGANREYLASDGSFSSLVPDLAAFAASPAAVAGGGGSLGRGRRLGLSGYAAGG